MRWSNLTLAAEEQRRLPGYRDEALVRRFDAPEALDIRFYEVRALSVLNRVPGSSPMPFRWTVNPYRGCTHACVYCLWGGTRILMANGRLRQLAHVQVGDTIRGTVPGGAPDAPRTLADTRVLAKWSTLKPAYRVVLENGVELVASGDHRFLTPEGWRYVAAGEQGASPRPCLQVGARLVGIEAAALAAATGTRALAAARSETLRPGAQVDGEAGLEVRTLQPLGLSVRMYDITTGTGDFVAEGVVSHNCFARPTHRYLNFDPGRDFEREIVVKVNAPEVLRRELARPGWEGEHVALGTNTDPYQWVEGRYRLMVGIWEALRDAAGGRGNPCSVLTKSPLLLRDLPLMRELARRTDFSACLSIPTLDERAWRATEPHTPNPRARLEAVAELNRAGIPTGVLIAPLMPGINDAPDQVEPLLQAAGEAGAQRVGGVALHLRRDVRDVFMQWLSKHRPELVPRYEDLYARGAYAPRPERERLSALVRAGGRKSSASRVRRVESGVERVRTAAGSAPPAEREASQQSLF